MSALIPENLTLCLFQQENVHLSLPLTSYFRANFLFVTKHIPQFQSGTIFFAMAFDGELCENLLKVKMDYIFSLSFIRSHECIPFQGNA